MDRVSLIEVAGWYREAGHSLYSDLLSKDMTDKGFRPCQSNGLNLYKVEDVAEALIERELPLEVLEERVKKFKN